MEYPFKKIYWLRGGLFFAVLSLLIYTFSSFFLIFYSSTSITNPSLVSGNITNLIWLATDKLSTFIVIGPGFLINFFDSFPRGSVVMSAIVVFVFWFVIGTILGWLYGKLKNKKHA